MHIKKLVTPHRSFGVAEAQQRSCYGGVESSLLPCPALQTQMHEFPSMLHMFKNTCSMQACLIRHIGSPSRQEVLCLQAPAEVMAAMLSHLDEMYGGPSGYLTSVGFTTEQQQRLSQAVSVTAGSQ